MDMTFRFIVAAAALTAFTGLSAAETVSADSGLQWDADVRAMRERLNGPQKLQAERTVTTSDTATPELDAALEEVTKRKETGLLTEVQYSHEIAALMKRYLPEDYEIHTVAEYRVYLATELEQKKISQAEFRYKWEERKNAFYTKRQRYIAAHTALIEQRRQVEISSQAREEAATDARRSGAIATLLQGVGNAFTRSAQPNSVRCTSIPVGASVSTTCY